MGSILAVTIILITLIPLAYMWVGAIEEMEKKHPNYKGEDLFDEDLKKKK